MSKAKTKVSRNPIDAGSKRTLKYLAIILVGATAVTSYFMYRSSQKGKEIQQTSNIGKVVTSAEKGESQLSPATRQMLARVHDEEARQAQREGRSYIPEMIFGEPIPVNGKEEEAPAPLQPTFVPGQQAASQPERPPQNRYASTAYRPQGQSPYEEDRKAQLQMIEQGLAGQIGMIANAMQAAPTPVPVVLNFSEERQRQKIQQAAYEAEMEKLRLAQGGALPGQSGEPAQAGQPVNRSVGTELVGGDEIVAAMTTTPIDTDTTTFVLAEIVGGKLNGAQLRGEVVPMDISGDIEDVGLRFTSMRHNGVHYRIDAIGLNESTATNALDGRVDRKTFSRVVMPIMMAGLTGVSQYFTVRGTPKSSVATNTTGDTIVVGQDRASKEDAKNQGIGEAVRKAVQTGDNMVNRAAARPSQVTLPANTPIGVMFNAPVIRIN